MTLQEVLALRATKPKKGQPSNGCGACCIAEVCGAMDEFMNQGLVPRSAAPCPALVTRDGRFWCGLVVDPMRFINSHYEQAVRQRWRARALVVKAKLEAVETGITTCEEEFLSCIVLPDNSTVGDSMLPQVEHAYSTGEMPRMLPSGKSSQETLR